jgi:hypothetical protein
MGTYLFGFQITLEWIFEKNNTNEVGFCRQVRLTNESSAGDTIIRLLAFPFNPTMWGGWTRKF